MNKYAKIIFDSVYSNIECWSNNTIRNAPISELPEKTQDEIKSVIHENMKTLAYYFFCRFDNVGCTLPEEVLSYHIIANPCLENEEDIEDIIELPPVDIRDGEMDYADMWLDYLYEKNEL